MGIVAASMIINTKISPLACFELADGVIQWWLEQGWKKGEVEIARRYKFMQHSITKTW